MQHVCAACVCSMCVQHVCAACVCVCVCSMCVCVCVCVCVQHVCAACVCVCVCVCEREREKRKVSFYSSYQYKLHNFFELARKKYHTALYIIYCLNISVNFVTQLSHYYLYECSPCHHRHRPAGVS